MLSKYFEIKTSSKEFEDNAEQIINDLKGKKVIIYGAGAGFFALDKIYNFKQKLNVVAISDKKFEKTKDGKTGLKEISPNQIPSQDFDAIVVTNEKGAGIEKFLTFKLNIEPEKIKLLFVEEFKDESANYNWLCTYKFSKTLSKLIEKLKGKTVVLYGAGAYLELINKYYDISGLNIIGIADRRFTENKDNGTFIGFKTYSPEQIKNLKPDYVLVSTRYYVSVIEELYYKTLKNTGIKIRPLVKKSFFTLLKELNW